MGCPELRCEQNPYPDQQGGGQRRLCAVHVSLLLISATLCFQMELSHASPPHVLCDAHQQSPSLPECIGICHLWCSTPRVPLIRSSHLVLVCMSVCLCECVCVCARRYYYYANLASLNRFRVSRGLNAIPYRPHAGEAGAVHHLASAFLTADGIAHGINLRHNQPLQYLYYLAQVISFVDQTCSWVGPASHASFNHM